MSTENNPAELVARAPLTVPLTQPAAPARLIACLCAEWCGTCGEWRTSFDAVTARYPHAQVVWVDIEDDAELMGDVEVETFPTLLIADVTEAAASGASEGAVQLRFFGPLAPHAGTFARLIESIDSPGGPVARVAPDVQALAERLSALR